MFSVNILTTLVVVAASGALIRAPQNAIGLQEDPLILECASNSSDILWSYNATNISGPGCTATDRRFTTTGVSNATHCSLVVRGTENARLSGAYRCSDGSQYAEAVVVTLGECTMFTAVFTNHYPVSRTYVFCLFRLKNAF